MGLLQRIRERFHPMTTSSLFLPKPSVVPGTDFETVCSSTPRENAEFELFSVGEDTPAYNIAVDWAREEALKGHYVPPEEVDKMNRAWKEFEAD